MRIFLKRKLISVFVLSVILVSVFTACGNNAAQTGGDSGTNKGTKEKSLSGEIIIDGSSTVFPVTEAVAEEFSKIYSAVRIPIGFSGTGGGFKKFTIGETDISNASRPIKENEIAVAKENGIEYVELKIAFDGLSVLVNSSNDWVDSVTVEELQKIWGPDSTVKKWKDIRPEWPDAAINLYGAGTDSGTFDYFTEVINGKTGAIRKDFTPSEDDNVLVQGIAGDKYSMGFFGFAYYYENKDKLKALKVDNGKGPVAPDFDTIMDGSYSPLSRPIYIYVNKKSLEKEHVKAFVEFYMTEGTKLIKSVGYVPLTEGEYKEQREKLK